jgi:hypothetical protein
VLARQGGDEFTIVPPELQARRCAQQIIAAKFFDSPQRLRSDGQLYDGRIGIAVYPGRRRLGSTRAAAPRRILPCTSRPRAATGFSFYDGLLPDAVSRIHQKIKLEQSFARRWN